jgi:hypothetical protein
MKTTDNNTTSTVQGAEAITIDLLQKEIAELKAYNKYCLNRILPSLIKSENSFKRLLKNAYNEIGGNQMHRIVADYILEDAESYYANSEGEGCGGIDVHIYIAEKLLFHNGYIIDMDYGMKQRLSEEFFADKNLYFPLVEQRMENNKLMCQLTKIFTNLY